MSTFSFPPRGLCIYCHLTPSSRLKFSGSTVAGSLPENKQKSSEKKGSTKLQRSKEFVAVIPKKLVFYWLVTHKKSPTSPLFQTAQMSTQYLLCWNICHCWPRSVFKLSGRLSLINTSCYNFNKLKF